MRLRKDLKRKNSRAHQIRVARGKLNVPRSLEELYTPQLLAKMFMAIRSGVFPHIAARAIGISETAFRNWMKYGAAGTSPYDVFFAAVQREAAAARAGAESAVYQDLPYMWLRYGPGRDTGNVNDPGWTDEQKIRHVGPGLGEAVPTVRLEFSVIGPRAIIEQPKQLEEKKED